MPDDQTRQTTAGWEPATQGKPSTAAERALAEAAERRRSRDAKDKASPRAPEVGGRDGPDPVRYGDWEKGGIVSDF